MHVQGLQKLTLLDFPTKLACTIFTHGCNLRCPFCHNADLVIHNPKAEIPETELFDFLKKRKGMLEGVCISGGEPLMNDDIIDFLKRIRNIGYNIKIDTNGFYPEKLKEIIRLGLVDYIAMDVKSSKENYCTAVGMPELDITPVCESVDIIKNSKIDYEFRTTAVKTVHCVEDFKKIGAWLGDVKNYYIQNFKNSENLISSQVGFSMQEMQEILAVVKENIKNAQLRGI